MIGYNTSFVLSESCLLLYHVSIKKTNRINGQRVLISKIHKVTMIKHTFFTQAIMDEIDNNTLIIIPRALIHKNFLNKVFINSYFIEYKEEIQEGIQRRLGLLSSNHTSSFYRLTMNIVL